MGVRTRKFIGAFGLVGFVCAYAVLVVKLKPTPQEKLENKLEKEQIP